MMKRSQSKADDFVNGFKTATDSKINFLKHKSFKVAKKVNNPLVRTAKPQTN